MTFNNDAGTAAGLQNMFLNQCRVPHVNPKSRKTIIDRTDIFFAAKAEDDLLP